MPFEQFSTITNMMVKRIDEMQGWGWTNFNADAEQRRQLNLKALEVAKDLSASSEQTRNNAARIIQSLCQEGLITEPQLIPLLIEGLKTENTRNSAFAKVELLHSLILMTRRMLGAAISRDLGPWMDSNPTNRLQIISWWENWWQAYQNEHPVYDEDVERKIGSSVLRVGNMIKEKVKPSYPELNGFQIQTNVHLHPRYTSVRLYEHKYGPEEAAGYAYFRTNDIMAAIPWERLPWLEVACRFEGQELPTYGDRFLTNRPPKRLESLLTSIYSNKIAGTTIYLEVRVASPNTNLANALKESLAKIERSP